MKTYIYGSTGRLGMALTMAFSERGDSMVKPDIPINYAVFAHRYRGAAGMMDEFAAQVFYVAEQCQQFQAADGDCGIVMVSSIVAEHPIQDAGINYVVAKAALNGLARYLALSRDKTRFRVNIVSPASFTGPSPHIPIQNVVDKILWLCSPESQYINGQDIKIT